MAESSGRSVFILALAGLLAGCLLLSEPSRNPVSTKIALSRVDRAPAATAEPSGPFPEALRAEADFLAPSQRWSQVIGEVARRFPGPDGREFDGVVPLATLIRGVRGGRGPCSYMTEALMVLCEVAGRPCREWGNVAYPQPDGTGHSVVDLWLPETARWAMLDVYLGIWARDAEGRPLSTPEFRSAFRERPDAVQVVPLAGRRVSRSELERIYATPGVELVELVRNQPLRVAAHWTRSVEARSRRLGQLLQWVTGVGPLFLIPDEPELAPLRTSLEKLRRRTLAGGALITAGGLGVIASILRARRRGR